MRVVTSPRGALLVTGAPLLAGALLVAGALFTAANCFAASPGATITLTLKDHRFTPSSVHAVAGEKIRVVLINQDGSTEEFDSHDLKVEQIVTPRGRASFDIGPLRPGRYAFMGEFHPDTAQGEVTVAAPGGG